MPRIPKPVLHLKMEGNAKDSSGYDNHGTVTAATLTDDRLGNPNSAYSFNGSTSFVNCGNDASLNMGSNDFSVGLWFKRITSTDTYRYLFAKGEVGEVRDKNYIIAVLADETIVGGIDDDTIVKITPASPATNDGNWHYVVSVRDGNYFRLYYDGIEQGTATDITRYGNIDHISPATVGVAYSAGIPFAGHYFNGSIDDTRIYPVALTPTQVKYLYDTTKRKYGRQVA